MTTGAPALEVAMIKVKPGSEGPFVVAYQSIKHVIGDRPVVRSMRMTRGVESPSTFVLMIEWDSVEAHNEFRESSAFGEWRGAIGPHFSEAPHVEHFLDV